MGGGSAGLIRGWPLALLRVGKGAKDRGNIKLPDQGYCFIKCFTGLINLTLCRYIEKLQCKYFWHDLYHSMECKQFGDLLGRLGNLGKSNWCYFNTPWDWKPQTQTLRLKGYDALRYQGSQGDSVDVDISFSTTPITVNNPSQTMTSLSTPCIHDLKLLFTFVLFSFLGLHTANW